ncbi:MAG: CoB--CoM heterodisulfide reductase iron-sulfur subunit B family protein [Candidatus Marinimicrobia bacterium]|nr:CoB--CoM heterodisulfide reductase iron-sulfur subunit B family protein [Candidatus Neomarinimicrobiota bacterium]MBL7046348.1 CoB--CoM heterodisulfide reductase iron-sulfur subunit B family protein [Candidatus Neomarinimicrobiota bacterium]
MKVSYYPGCSLHSTALEYDESTQEVCQILDIDLNELNDWNCCGASSAHSTDEILAIELPLRNLVTAEEAGMDLVVPCAACFQRLKVAEKHIIEEKEPAIETSYQGKVPVKHLLDFFSEEENLKVIKEKVKKPLSGLKAVCYYGCLIVRPPEITDAIDHENPQAMDELLTLLGAETYPWSYKTDCCGGGLLLSRTDIIIQLSGKLLQMAEESGANCIVTACPVCQVNLDTRQAEISKNLGKEVHFPVFYFTELLGLALGSEEVGQWLERHIADPSDLLKSKNLL